MTHRPFSIIGCTSSLDGTLTSSLHADGNSQTPLLPSGDTMLSFPSIPPNHGSSFYHLVDAKQTASNPPSGNATPATAVPSVLPTSSQLAADLSRDGLSQGVNAKKRRVSGKKGSTAVVNAANNNSNSSMGSASQLASPLLPSGLLRVGTFSAAEVTRTANSPAMAASDTVASIAEPALPCTVAPKRMRDDNSQPGLRGFSLDQDDDEPEVDIDGVQQQELQQTLSTDSIGSSELLNNDRRGASQRRGKSRSSQCSRSMAIVESPTCHDDTESSSEDDDTAVGAATTDATAAPPSVLAKQLIGAFNALVQHVEGITTYERHSSFACAAVPDRSLDGRVVSFAVGGQVHDVSVATLKKEPVSLPLRLALARLQGDTSVPTTAAGNIIIDRDGKTFGVLVNQLRGYRSGCLGTDAELSSWAMQDAVYYGFHNLLRRLKGQRTSVTDLKARFEMTCGVSSTGSTLSCGLTVGTLTPVLTAGHHIASFRCDQGDSIAIGVVPDTFSAYDTPFSQAPGAAAYLQTGHLQHFFGTSLRKLPLDMSFGTNDVVTVGIDFDTRRVYWEKNGASVAILQMSDNVEALKFAVGLRRLSSVSLVEAWKPATTRD